VAFTYILNIYSTTWFNGYEFGFEILIANGLFTFIGLYLIRNRKERKEKREKKLPDTGYQIPDTKKIKAHD